MTPLSLVGMTMGARKRAARFQYMLHTYEIGPARREALSLFAPCDAASHTYKRAWRMYRIGQRLRPCPGEYQCKNCSQNNWCRCTDTEADAECVVCGVSHQWPCDGSGVLPARAKKVRR